MRKASIRVSLRICASFLLAGCWPNPDHDPATWRAVDADIRAIHDAWCADPRGTLPDGSCAR